VKLFAGSERILVLIKLEAPYPIINSIALLANVAGGIIIPVSFKDNVGPILVTLKIGFPSDV
jgi:hypothetical protein